MSKSGQEALIYVADFSVTGQEAFKYVSESSETGKFVGKYESYVSETTQTDVIYLANYIVSTQVWWIIYRMLE